MGCIPSALAVGALIATYGTGLFPVAIGCAVLLFWSSGVIANYGHNPLEAPNWAAVAGMAASLGTLVLLVAGLVIRLSTGGSLSWEGAPDHVGDRMQVCGPLRGVAEDGGDTFLNVGEPYPNPRRFSIVVWDTTNEVHPQLGSEVCVTGEISEYRGVAQVQTHDWNDIEVKQ